MTKPSAAVAFAKIVQGQLRIPYSLSGRDKLAGHCYDCRVVGQTFFRFEEIDSAVSGVCFLAIAENETLKGGRWMGSEVSEIIRRDLSRLSESVPGMQPLVWIRIRKKEMPVWAEKYFRDDWPNKH